MDNPTLTTLDVTINPNGNPIYTLFAIYNVTGGIVWNTSLTGQVADVYILNVVGASDNQVLSAAGNTATLFNSTGAIISETDVFGRSALFYGDLDNNGNDEFAIYTAAVGRPI